MEVGDIVEAEPVPGIAAGEHEGQRCGAGPAEHHALPIGEDVGGDPGDSAGPFMGVNPCVVDDQIERRRFDVGKFGLRLVRGIKFRYG